MSKFLIAILVVDLIILHSLLAYLSYRSFSPSPQLPTPVPTNYPSPSLAPTSTTVPSIITATPNTPLLTKTATKTTRRVSYISIPSNGSTIANVWTDLPGTEFYFDSLDFPNLSEIRFEANLRLFNGNGLAFIRLYDIAHGIGVPGSEIQSAGQAGTAVISNQVTFWSGKNIYRVQARSLTADTTIFSGGRLKITTID